MTTAPVALVSATSKPRLRLRTRAAYGLGDLANQFTWTVTASYLAVFYTDTVGVAAGTVAVLLLVARVLDALIDPVVGMLAERTRSKWGRFRPWVLFGMVPLGILLVMTFTAPFSGQSNAAVIWAAITYGLLGFAFSALNVPYSALASVMAETTADRVSLNSFRMIGTNVGNVLIAAVTVPLVALFTQLTGGDPAHHSVMGYTLTAVLFALVSLPMFFVVFASSKEVVTPVHGERMPVKASLRTVVTNVPLMLTLAVTLLALTSFFGRLGVILYYYLYNVHNMTLIPLLMSVPSIAAIIGIAAFTRFARRVGKRNLLAISLIAQSLALIALYLVGYDNLGAILVLSFIYGLSTFGTPLVLSMVPDCIDYAEDKTGFRADGTAYAVVSFSTKIAAAIGGAVGVALIGSYGYVPNAQQSIQVLGGINFVVNLLPAIVALVALLPLAFYKLGEQQVAEIRNRLDAAQHTGSAI